MDTIETTKITAGDIVLHRGEVFQVVPGSCSQCDMFNHIEKRCRGYCYRWPGMGGLVFRYLGNEFAFDDWAKVYVSVDVFTPRIEELCRTKNYHYTRKGGDQ